MKRRLSTLGLSGLAVLAWVSCADEAVPYLTSVTEEPPGSHCAEGGSKLDFGGDSDGDGSLGTSEVSASAYVCNGAAILGAIVSEATLATGDANCPEGGLSIAVGIDSNDNGEVDSSEGSRHYLCNGAQGSAGAAGPSGDEGEVGPAGSQGNAGPQGDAGPQGAGGPPGGAGDDGHNSLVSVTEEGEGVNCEGGGVRIQVGIDDNDDTVLDAGEVDDVDFVCNPTPECVVVEHDFSTGDDRGGIAISDAFVYYTGDNTTARFDVTDLGNQVQLQQGGNNVPLDGIVSDLDTGLLYSLSVGNGPLNQDVDVCGVGNITELITLDPADASVGATTPLSQPIPYECGSGIFAGPSFMLLVTTSTMFRIDFADGTVTDLGPKPVMPANGCENWAFWGFAQDLGAGEIGMVYASDSSALVRTVVSTGNTSVLEQFNDLSDMCSITASPSRGRWYFHYEGNGQFGGNAETMGSCRADFFD